MIKEIIEAKVRYEQFADILGDFEYLRWVTLKFIGYQVGDEKLSKVIFDGMSFRSIREIFKKIVEYKYKDKPILEELRKIAKDLEKAGDNRNEVAHSGIGFNYESKVRKKYIASKKKERFNMELDLETLKKYDNQIISTATRLWETMDELKYIKLVRPGIKMERSKLY